MSLVTTTQEYLDGIVGLAIVGTIFIIVAIIAVIYIIIEKYRTPKPSTNLTKAHRKHIPLILLAGLDHFADLMPLKDFIPEVLESFPFGKKPKQRTYRFALPQKVNVADFDIPIDSDKDELHTKQYMQGLNDLNTQKLFLRGVNSPILVGVKNRSLAASIPFLSAMNFTKDIDTIANTPKVIEALNQSKSVDARNVGAALSRLATGISTVDFHAVYKYVDINWDHTINESISERDKTDGRLERSDDKDKGTKTVLYLIMGVIGLAVVLVAAAYVLR